MITDLNLGPSLRTSDLGQSKSKEKLDLLKPESGAQSAGSFDQALQAKLAKDKNGKPELEKRQENQPRMATEKKSTTERSEKSERSDAKESRDEEAGSVRKKEKSKETKAKDKAPSEESTRESVMLQFMDSIESELGIPPERMLEAMTNISSADAESSPEDSASQVIAQLQLPPDQAAQAYQMYTQMLGDLSQLPKPEMKPQILATAMVPASAITLKERKDLLNNSLDRMNSNFFMRQELMKQGPMGPTAEMTALSSDVMPMDQMSMRGGDALAYKASLNNNPNMPMMDRPMPDDLQPTNPDAIGGMSNEKSESMKKLAEKLALLGATAGAIDKSIQADPQNMQALKAEQWLKSQGIENPAAGAAGISAMAGGAAMGALGGDSEDSSEDLGHNGSSDSLANLGHISHKAAGAENSQFANALAGAGTAAGTGKAGGDGENQANLNQLMQQAKFMIKKGGGESIVKMSPEGLGNMHMKVMVQDGKVSVEMATDNKEAKKLIESSVNDLRLGLGAHKLTVDSIKVDVGTNLSDNKNSDQNPQKQMGSNADQGQNQARQFMGQFREENMGRRDGAFWDSPGLRAYSSGRQIDPLKPADSAQARARYTGEKKGSGLDLVA